MEKKIKTYSTILILLFGLFQFSSIASASAYTNPDPSRTQTELQVKFTRNYQGEVMDQPTAVEDQERYEEAVESTPNMDHYGVLPQTGARLYQWLGLIGYLIMAFILITLLVKFRHYLKQKMSEEY